MPKIKKTSKESSNRQTSPQFATEIQRLHLQWKKHCEAELKGVKKLIIQLKDTFKKVKMQNKATKSKKLASGSKAEKNKTARQQIINKIRLLTGELTAAQDYLHQLKIKYAHCVTSEKTFAALNKNFDKQQKQSLSSKKNSKKTTKTVQKKTRKSQAIKKSKSSDQKPTLPVNNSNEIGNGKNTNDNNDFHTLE